MGKRALRMIPPRIFIGCVTKRFQLFVKESYIQPIIQLFIHPNNNKKRIIEPWLH